jgi:hypothetical protein
MDNLTSILGGNGLSPCFVPLASDLEPQNEEERKDWSHRRNESRDFVSSYPFSIKSPDRIGV